MSVYPHIRAISVSMNLFDRNMYSCKIRCLSNNISDTDRSPALSVAYNRLRSAILLMFGRHMITPSYWTTPSILGWPVQGPSCGVEPGGAYSQNSTRKTGHNNRIHLWMKSTKQNGVPIASILSYFPIRYDYRSDETPMTGCCGGCIF